MIIQHTPRFSVATEPSNSNNFSCQSTQKCSVKVTAVFRDVRPHCLVNTYVFTSISEEPTAFTFRAEE
jgi:hypothetical protein